MPRERSSHESSRSRERYPDDARASLPWSILSPRPCKGRLPAQMSPKSRFQRRGKVFFSPAGVWSDKEVREPEHRCLEIDGFLMLSRRSILKYRHTSAPQISDSHSRCASTVYAFPDHTQHCG